MKRTRVKKIKVIQTQDPEEFQNTFNKTMEEMKMFNGNGGYTGSDVKIIYTVLSSNEFIALKKDVKEKNKIPFISEFEKMSDDELDKWIRLLADNFDYEKYNK